MKSEKITSEVWARIRECIEHTRFGSVTVVVQDGYVVQIEKHEKERLNS